MKFALLQKNTTQKGFTLVEMMVSLAIFVVVALVAVGALLRIMDANRKSISLKNATTNLNFTLESMSREMRVGSKYYITNSISGGINSPYSTSPSSEITSSVASPQNWVIVFTSSKNNSNNACSLIYAYKYDSGTKRLQKAQQGDTCAAISDSDFQDITAPDVVITNASVEVGANNQPYAFFVFKGYTGLKKQDQTDFSLQTRVSQRIK